jgi:hypothetical protein
VMPFLISGQRALTGFGLPPGIASVVIPHLQHKFVHRLLRQQ